MRLITTILMLLVLTGQAQAENIERLEVQTRTNQLEVKGTVFVDSPLYFSTRGISYLKSVAL